MSEPVQNAQIEDVLSSIRRLVSEDHRKQSERRQARSDRGATRLVLTEALRVPEANTEDEPEQALETGTSSLRDDDAFYAPAAEDDLSGADPWAAIEGTTTDDWDVVADAPRATFTSHRKPTVSEQNDTDDAPWRDPEARLFDAARQAQDDDETDLIAPEEQAPDSAEPAESDARALGDKIADLERVIARANEEWEPDDPGVDAYSGSDVDTFVWVDPNDTPEPATNEPRAQDAKEELIARRALEPVEEPKPRDEAETAFQQPAESVEEPADFTDAEAKSDFEAADTPAHENEAGSAPEADAADTLIDEDALRELVAAVLREELQGPLGERITRNVRKLVRREIHRALAVRDLD
jgi:hypothetical protein